MGVCSERVKRARRENESGGAKRTKSGRLNDEYYCCRGSLSDEYYVAEESETFECATSIIVETEELRPTSCERTRAVIALID